MGFAVAGLAMRPSALATARRTSAFSSARSGSKQETALGSVRSRSANATATREREPGCRQFDVCTSADDGLVFLYEVYDDRAAFDAHLAAPHF
jgi:quinol monooxygenase YgiN